MPYLLGSRFSLVELFWLVGLTLTFLTLAKPVLHIFFLQIRRRFSTNKAGLTLAGSYREDSRTMEVDQQIVEWSYAGEGSRLPLIDESSALGTQAPKDR